MKPFAKIVESFRSQGVVVPLPGELSLEVTARGQRLTCFNDLQEEVNMRPLVEVV